MFQNVEGTQGDEQTVHLVDPTQAASAYLSIEDAIAHAASGDTIVVAAGTYNDNLTITKDVTIVGPNAGKLLADTRNAEASIGGLVTIVADGVTIDGVKFAEGALSAWTGRPTAIVLDNDATGLTVTSSLFARTGGGNSSGIETYYGGNNDNLTVTNSSFSGWNIAIYLNPGADNAVITDNAFSNGGGVATDKPNRVPDRRQCLHRQLGPLGMTNSASGFDADFANGGPVAAGNTFTASNYDVDIAPTVTEGQVLNGTALRDYFAGDVAWASAFGRDLPWRGRRRHHPRRCGQRRSVRRCRPGRRRWRRRQRRHHRDVGRDQRHLQRGHQ